MGRSRVCFAQSVISSDEFLELPPIAQIAYYQLAIEADNDGAVDGFKRKLRSYGASDEDAKALFDAGYLLDVDGVVFITHWRVNNTLDTHNYRPGGHVEEFCLIDQGPGLPYRLPDYNQTDDSLESVANKNKTKQNEPNRKESNQTQLNKKESRLSQSSRGIPGLCPDCGDEMTFDRFEAHPDQLYGYCCHCFEDKMIREEDLKPPSTPAQ